MTDMILNRGDDASRVVTVIDRVTLEPRDITGATLRWSCRAMLGAPSTVLRKSTTDDGGIMIDPDQAEPDSGDLHHRGEATITFGRDDFEDVSSPTIYVWDLEVEDTEANLTTVLSGRLLVRMDVTHSDD